MKIFMQKKSVLCLFIIMETVSGSMQVFAAEGVEHADQKECVILLHGLGRTERAMVKLEEGLNDSGFMVVNESYPSRDHEVKELAEIAIQNGLEECELLNASSINFVTHSLGGILVRQYLRENEIDQLDRVVMLGPPNQGSEVVDNFRDVPGFDWMNGPAGLQLGTDEGSFLHELGAVDFDLGIVAGNRTINPLLSQFLPNPDDGKVSVESTKVEGMCSFIEMPVSHALMMRNEDVIIQLLTFLEQGEFTGENAQNDLCVDQ